MAIDNALTTVTPRVGRPNPRPDRAAELGQLCVAATNAALAYRGAQAGALLAQAARERPERMRQSQQA